MPSQTLRRLAGATAVALAFSATANAAGFIDSDRSLLTARVNVDNAIAQAAPNDPAPRLRAGGFMKGLETVLKDGVPDPQMYIFTGRDGKSGTLIYPKDNSTNMLVIASVVPPKGSEHLPIAVCAQQNRQVVGAWNITAKGDVTPREIVANPEGSDNKPACNATIVAARAEITRLAQSNQPAQPPSASEPTKPTPMK